MIDIKSMDGRYPGQLYQINIILVLKIQILIDRNRRLYKLYVLIILFKKLVLVFRDFQICNDKNMSVKILTFFCLICIFKNQSIFA